MNPKRVYQWVKRESKKWQAAGFSQHFGEAVTLFSRGVARAKSSQIRKIACKVGGHQDSQRRRLQRFVGRKIELTDFFTVWTTSVLKAVKSKKRLILSVDEVKLEDRFGVMVVGLVYAGRCLPLAWRVYRANDKASYPAEGQVEVIGQLLDAINADLPPQQKVLLLTDRGIGTSSDLMRRVEGLGWSYLFRVTKHSTLILADGQSVKFYDQVSEPGQSYQAQGLVFKSQAVPAQVRVLWGHQAKEPWGLVTNDDTISGWEYGQRMWQEESFRDLKSYGWQLEETQFTEPDRLARLWIILVVAYVWLILWGRELEQRGLTQPPSRREDGRLVRRWSLFREGLHAFEEFICQLRI